MKIIDKRFNTKEEFRDIEVGEFFEYDHECYIKISECSAYYFEGTEEVNFVDGVMVNKIKVELHIIG